MRTPMESLRFEIVLSRHCRMLARKAGRSWRKKLRVMDKNKISEALQAAIEYALTETDADRVIVVYEGLGASKGFDLPSSKVLEEGPLSLQMLESFLHSREAVLIKQATTHPEFEYRISAVLSQLGSVVFVPILNEGSLTRGFLYMDQVGRSTFLSAGFLERMKRYVREVLQPKIHVPNPHLDWSEVSSVEWIS